VSANENQKTKKARVLPDCPHEYFDSHCHLDAILQSLNDEKQKKKEKREKKSQQVALNDEMYTLQTLREQLFKGNFGGCITVCCEEKSIEPTLQLLDQDKTNKIWATFGIHPHEAKDYNDEIEKRIIGLMSSSKTVAWGECGLDYFYKFSDPDIQQRVFIRQIQRAVECKKPLVVHSRDAEQDTIQIMCQHLPVDWHVHLHCFTSSIGMADTLLKHFPNLCVGFTGCITFKTADVNRQSVKAIPLDRLLLETDGPYMAPDPFRGATAHPGHIPLTAQVMADVKGVPLSELLKQVRLNVKKVYNV